MLSDWLKTQKKPARINQIGPGSMQLKFFKNPNRVKGTSFWLTVRETWCKQKYCQKNRGKRTRIEKLNNLLETFYAEVKDKNGDDCEPDNLKVMIAALDRHLNEKGS